MIKKLGNLDGLYQKPSRILIRVVRNYCEVTI